MDRPARPLIERVVFDAVNARVAITFQPTGIATLGAPDAPQTPNIPGALEGTDGARVDPDIEEAAA